MGTDFPFFWPQGHSSKTAQVHTQQRLLITPLAVQETLLYGCVIPNSVLTAPTLALLPTQPTLTLFTGKLLCNEWEICGSSTSATSGFSWLPTTVLAWNKVSVSWLLTGTENPALLRLHRIARLVFNTTKNGSSKISKSLTAGQGNGWRMRIHRKQNKASLREEGQCSQTWTLNLVPNQWKIQITPRKLREDAKKTNKTLTSTKCCNFRPLYAFKAASLGENARDPHVLWRTPWSSSGSRRVVALGFVKRHNKSECWGSTAPYHGRETWERVKAPDMGLKINSEPYEWAPPNSWRVSGDVLDSPRGLEKEAEWEKELLLWSNSL